MQDLVNALMLAGIYAIVGLGFSLVYGVMNVLNLAYGAFIMLGAYLSFWLFQSYGIDPFLSIPVSMAALFLLGFVLQRYLLNLIVKAGLFMMLILTFGLEIIIVNVALQLWSADYRSILPSYRGQGFEIGQVIVSYAQTGVLFVAILLTVLLVLFMGRTRIGLAIRATAQDRTYASAMGVNIATTYAITFGISSALAGAAGTLVASVYPISPNMGSSLLFKAFAISVLGGLGSLSGAMVGALVLAFAEVLGAAWLGATYQDLIGYAILVTVMAFRSQGILGKKFAAEVKV